MLSGLIMFYQVLFVMFGSNMHLYILPISYLMMNISTSWMRHYMKAFLDLYRKSLLLISLFVLFFYAIPLVVLLFDGIQISSRSLVDIDILLVLLRNTLVLCISIVVILAIALLICYNLFLHHKRTSSFLMVMLIPFIIPCSQVQICV